MRDGHWVFRDQACPGCGQRVERFVGWRGGEAQRAGRGLKTRIVRCRACGLLYPNPVPMPRDHSHYADPDAYFGSHGAAAGRVDNYVGIIRDSQRRGATGPMLDIGCGRGESLLAAKQLGWEARGVEPADEFRREGEKLGLQIDGGSVDERHPDNGFGLVLLSAVLEHVYDPVGMLRACRRVLRPGGVLYLDVPNERSLLHRLARIGLLATGRDWTLCLSPTFPPYHVIGFSPRSLTRMLARAGFGSVDCEGYPMRWIGGAVGYRVESVLAPVRLSAGLLAWAR